MPFRACPYGSYSVDLLLRQSGRSLSFRPLHQAGGPVYTVADSTAHEDGNDIRDCWNPRPFGPHQPQVDESPWQQFADYLCTNRPPPTWPVPGQMGLLQWARSRTRRPCTRLILLVETSFHFVHTSCRQDRGETLHQAEAIIFDILGR